MQGFSLKAGSVIAGRYRLEEQLGRGGMGVVWAATHTVTERAVALKFLHGPAHLQSQLRQRFLREARAASAVQHPNVVDVLDVFELDDRTPVMVMERLYGETLGQRLLRVKTAAREAAQALLAATLPEGAAETPAQPVPRASGLSLAATAALFVPIVSALGTAHLRGVVHRDLKPDNIFIEIDADGREQVKVLDFGVAKLVRDGIAISVTETGGIVGTPCYMAPEQALGERVIDHRADVWALGVMLYECLTGVRPIEGDSFGQVVVRVAREEIRALAATAPELPLEVSALVDRMLQRDRDRRPDLHEVLSVLEHHTTVRAPLFSAAGAPRVPSERPFVDAHGPTERVSSRPQTAAGHELPSVRPSESKPPAARRFALLVALAGLIAALVFLARRSTAPSEPRTPGSASTVAPTTAPRALRARMLTALPAEDRVGGFDLNRDGTEYVYHTASGVWLASIQGGEPRRLKHVEAERPLEVRFMPNGQTLALLRNVAAGPSPDALEIALLPLAGGKARVLPTDCTVRGSHSIALRPRPDGREIAVACSDTLLAVDIQSGTARRIASRTTDEIAAVDWAPDGSRLAFISGAFKTASAAELHVLRADGTDDRRLISDAKIWSGRSGAALVWLDERRLVFSRLSDVQEAAGGGIWELDVDGPVAAGNPRLIHRHERQNTAELRFSRAAGRLVSLLSRTQGDVYVGELRHGASELANPSRLTLHDADDRPSAWLPDGRVLFMSDRYGSLDVLAQAPGSPDAELITSDRKWETWPGLIGSSIAYFSIDPSPALVTRSAALVRRDGSGREQRVLDRPLETPIVRETAPPPIEMQFSCTRTNNPTCVLGEYQGGIYSLRRFDPRNGRTESPLYQRAATRGASLEISPDARQIAMVGWEISGLVLVTLAGGESREIKLGPGQWQSVHWLPDGSGVVLTGMNFQNDLYVVARADLRGKVTPLRTSQTTWFTQALPSPDGKRLAFGAISYERNLELYEGW